MCVCVCVCNICACNVCAYVYVRLYVGLQDAVRGVFGWDSSLRQKPQARTVFQAGSGTWSKPVNLDKDGKPEAVCTCLAGHAVCGSSQVQRVCLLVLSGPLVMAVTLRARNHVVSSSLILHSVIPPLNRLFYAI